MLQKAIVEEVLENGQQARVRIPRYNKSSSASLCTPREELYIATVCTLPGISPNIQINDVVFVDFENDKLDSPVILGLLYRKDNINSSVDILCDSIAVSTNCDLPISDDQQIQDKLSEIDQDIKLTNDSIIDNFNKLVSRGEQLVVNGNTYLMNNTNFTKLTYVNEQYNNSSGAFTMPSGTPRTTIISSEFFPIDISKTYEFSVDVKSLTGLGTFYAFVAPYDRDNVLINGKYKYLGISGSVVPTTWTHYSALCSGIDGVGLNTTGKFPPGTVKGKVGFLWNYNSANDQFWVTNICFNQTNVISSTAEPTSAQGNNGDIWITYE